MAALNVAARTAFAQTPVGKLSHVAYGAIHGKYAARETSVGRSSSIFNHDFDRAELVDAFRHACGGHRVGNEDGALDAFRLQKDFHDFRRDVNSIGDEVGCNVVVAEHFSDDSGIAMIQGPHSVESVSRVTRSGGDRALRDRKFGIRVTDAHADATPSGFGDNLHCSGNFGCDGEHLYMTARRLPEAIEDFERGVEQIFGRMDAASLVAEKRSFKMDAERACVRVVLWRSLCGLQSRRQVGRERRR